MAKVWTATMPRERRVTWRASLPCWIGLVGGTAAGLYLRLGDWSVFLTRERHG